MNHFINEIASRVLYLTVTIGSSSVYDANKLNPKKENIPIIETDKYSWENKIAKYKPQTYLKGDSNDHILSDLKFFTLANEFAAQQIDIDADLLKILNETIIRIGKDTPSKERF